MKILAILTWAQVQRKSLKNCGGSDGGMRNIQWEETDLETIYVGSSLSIHYPMPLVAVAMQQLVCNTHSCRVTVVLVLVALVVSLAWDGGQSVRHLMNCHRSGEDLGRSRSYLIPRDTAAGLPTAADDRNDRREDGYDQGNATGASEKVWSLKSIKSIWDVLKCMSWARRRPFSFWFIFQHTQSTLEDLTISQVSGVLL